MSGADVFLRSVYQDWPPEASQIYERIEVLGRGSFGVVWMAKRTTPRADQYDDDFVAVKNIEVPDDKGALYAEREIRILKELKHPNVIRFIREFPVHDGKSRLVVLQLARGINLNQLVMTCGALGMPVARLLCRQLVAAVSYLHGRGVIHRDIKPGNCILENCHLGPHEENEWIDDETIWGDGDVTKQAIQQNKWKLMLIDFGFARALGKDELKNQNKHLRNSIMMETGSASLHTDEEHSQTLENTLKALQEEIDFTDSDESENGDADKKDTDNDNENGSPDQKEKDEKKKLAKEKVESARLELSGMLMEEDDTEADADVTEVAEANGDKFEAKKQRPSLSEKLLPLTDEQVDQLQKAGSKVPGSSRFRDKRMSTARRKMRSMSALGTKAYAAPEIKKKLRKKTAEDHGKKDAALTECVADYGMIVDAYSVGWTMRVLLTGVPPNCTISQYQRKLAEDEERRRLRKEENGGFCSLLCCRVQEEERPPIHVRDATDIPKEATVLITQLTKPDPEERITVREAQIHPWICGGNKGEDKWDFPKGDVPSQHGDPVVPLECAEGLSALVEGYHDDR